MQKHRFSQQDDYNSFYGLVLIRCPTGGILKATLTFAAVYISDSKIPFAMCNFFDSWIEKTREAHGMNRQV